jgi:hypothetical protein
MRSLEATYNTTDNLSDAYFSEPIQPLRLSPAEKPPRVSLPTTYRALRLSAIGDNNLLILTPTNPTLREDRFANFNPQAIHEPSHLQLLIYLCKATDILLLGICHVFTVEKETAGSGGRYGSTKSGSQQGKTVNSSCLYSIRRPQLTWYTRWHASCRID